MISHFDFNLQIILADECTEAEGRAWHMNVSEKFLISIQTSERADIELESVNLFLFIRSILHVSIVKSNLEVNGTS